MHKPMIAALLLILAVSAAGNPHDYALHQINLRSTKTIYHFTL